MTTQDRLRLALSAFQGPRTPGRILSLLRAEGTAGLARAFERLDSAQQGAVLAHADKLREKNVDVVLFGEADYPPRLSQMASPPPVIFYWGNRELFYRSGVGMCGSRDASSQGLRAAQACGAEVARHGLSVVSGYAKGVDTETHLAALSQDGRTVVVLAEGIDHFRIKRVFDRAKFTTDSVLVISQFAPAQPWSAGGAMTRNGVIVGLGLALVVVEAGETGGTLAAGIQALETGTTVFVLDFDKRTPPGNRLLLDRGAVPITSRELLGNELDGLDPAPAEPAATPSAQLSLLG